MFITGCAFLFGKCANYTSSFNAENSSGNPTTMVGAEIKVKCVKRIETSTFK